MNIQVYRRNVPTIELPLNAATYTRKLMAEHELVFSFATPVNLDLRVGDTLTYKGELMTLNSDPERTLTHLKEYNLTFQGQRHTLERFILKDEGKATFDYFGELDVFMLMFLEYVNSLDEGWSIGELDATEPISLRFDKVDCYSALNDIAQAFAYEWQIKGKAISIKKTIGTATTLSFSYGMGNGLYSLTRNLLENSRIITRAYAYGGTQNLPKDYPYEQLTMPGFLEDPALVERYGHREGYVEDLEIYPNRTSTATNVGQINEGTFELIDTALDFDLNGQRITGEDAYIVFKTGILSGMQFKILSYSPSRKSIRYEANKETNGTLMPRSGLVAEIGNQYTLIGIRMPETYVTAALAKLEEKRTEYFADNSVPRVAYDLDIDVLHLKRLAVEPGEGDIINIKDASEGIDEDVRVTSISYPAHFPDVLEQGMNFTCEVGNDVTYTRVQKIEKDIKDTRNVVTQVSRESWENDRRNVLALNEFKSMVFDPDGNLENPLIQAIAGLFGTDSQYYDLVDVSMSVNAGGDPNAFTMTGGRLVHKRYSIDGTNFIWQLSPFSVSDLVPTQAYYLAAKCSRTSLTGEWVLSETQIPTDAESNFWYFNLGVLSSVLDGSRSFRPTKMFTMISGGNIETDTITAYFINVVRLFAQVITVGSDGFVNAGISGLSDNANQSVRFWAGADAQGKDAAPFRVLNNGSMYSTRGFIGGFDINQDSLRAGRDDTWEVNGQSVFMTPNYFLLRDNGTIRGQRREFAWNLYKEVSGSRRSAAASIFNTVATADAQFPYTNIALELEARNGNHNYALVIANGTSKMRAICHDFQTISGQNQTIDDGVSIVLISESTHAGRVNLPTFPKLGYQVTIKNLSPNDFELHSTNGSIIQSDGSPAMSNFFRRRAIKTFFNNGQYWIEMYSQTTQ
ncbi:phage tail protein [Sphingobacterium sp. lm-10]|uniref:phage tail protein n=1 Tax=Sphingobacterium sp. lm-10 TaxID=2944904 RepID=UPI0020206048|nr:phage tail protein [Sphingobacterium sp. lm-10]MCL7987725.1 phage tail protein [Sphingobacterium sp. lm-10]